MQTNSRRQFLKTTVATSAVAAVHSSTKARADSSNDTIRVAVVGLGGRGRRSLCTALRELAKEGVEIVAMSDVDEKRMNDAADENQKLTGKRPKTAVDMRDFLDDAGIDAVVLATPNHWHALQTIWCCQAGKDVYVEKPASHNVVEGRRMIEAARKYDRMVQFETRDGYTNNEAGMGTTYPFVDHKNVVGVIFLGTEGYIVIPDYSSYHTFLGPKREPGPSDGVPGAAMMDADHVKNWLDVIRSRKHTDLFADIAEGHLSASICHLANAASDVGRTLSFDADAEQFQNDPEANRLLTRDYRPPYVLPDSV